MPVIITAHIANVSPSAIASVPCDIPSIDMPGMSM